jgi:hypothetical protein
LFIASLAIRWPKKHRQSSIQNKDVRDLNRFLDFCHHGWIHAILALSAGAICARMADGGFGKSHPCQGGLFNFG